MKKVVLLLLLLAGFFSLAFPQQSGTCGDNVVWTYSYSDRTLTIRPAEGTQGGPMEDYYGDVAHRPWATRNLNISKVIIEEGVTSIGSSAFWDYRGLISVTIPEGVTSIGECAFEDCSGLTSVTIPESVTSIGDDAFRGTAIKSPLYNSTVFAYMPSDYSGAYTIPSGTQSIAGGAFAYCSGLTSVTIPESVAFIGGYAFSECSSLTSITIPEGVTSIGDNAFRGTAIKSLLYSSTVFAYIPSDYSGAYTIPSGTQSIAGGAFAYCSGLTSVTIPESVTFIGDYAFRNCIGLKEVINYRRDPPYQKYTQPFFDVDASKVQLLVPAGSRLAYRNREIWYAFQIVEIMDAPEFSERENVLTCGTRVSIASASSDAEIYYGIGKDAYPALRYEGSIAVTDTTYICAFAQRDGERSVVVRATYFANHASSLMAHEAVASTCTEEGREAYWECGRCEKLFGDAEARTEIAEPEVIEALGHDLTVHEAVAATCTEEGRNAYWVCGRCEKLFSDAEATTEIAEPEVIEALGHDLTAHEAVAATCTEEGREAYWECGRCEKLFSDAEATTEIAEPVKIAAQGHAYGQPVWAWTEDYQASVTFICTRCSHEENPEVTVRSEITRPATATMEGERTYTATVVFEGEIYTDTKTEVIEAEQTASEATSLVRGVKIYPNPSRGEFKVELPVDVQVEIFDASGRKVLAQPRSAGTHGFSLAQTGMYVLKVSTSGQQAVFRIVVR